MAEGSLIDGIFEVKALGFPPAESESVTRFSSVKIYIHEFYLNILEKIQIILWKY